MKVIYRKLGVPYFLVKDKEDYTLFVDLNLMNEELIKELKNVLKKLNLEF